MLPLLDNAQSQRLCADRNQRQQVSVAHCRDSLQGAKDFSRINASSEEKIGSSQRQASQNITSRNPLSHLHLRVKDEPLAI